jgi:hypothetical protein
MRWITAGGGRSVAAAISRLGRQPRPPVPTRPRIDREALIDAVRNDPELRKEPLQALLAGAV